MIKWLHCMLLRAMLRHSIKLETDYSRSVEDYNIAINSALANGRPVGNLILTRSLYESMIAQEKSVQAEYRSKLLYMGVLHIQSDFAGKAKGLKTIDLCILGFLAYLGLFLGVELLALHL